MIDLKQFNKDHKEDYLNIKASDELKERIDDIMNNKPNNNLKMNKIIIAIAASLAIFIGAANMTPTIANATKEVPVLGKIVNIVTLGRFEYEDDNFYADISTPQIEGLLDKEFEAELNEKFKNHADHLIVAFESEIKEMKESYGEGAGHLGIESDYLIRTNNDDFLSLDIYTLSTAGSSNTTHSFYTIDKSTNSIIKLEELFKDDVDWTKPISEYILAEMNNQMKNDENTAYWIDGSRTDFISEEDIFKEIKKDQDFYINEKNQLIIAFDKYEVGPGSQGSPEFVIPNEVISDFLVNENIK